MYGSLVLSLYKNDKSQYFIDVDYAPEGCAMVHDTSLEIKQKQFLSLVQTIKELLEKKVETDDYGCSDCYVEISDDKGNEQTYVWPEDLHSDTFRAISELINGITHNDVASDFISMF